MRKPYCLLVSALLVLFNQSNAYAMHIMEGYLPLGWSIAWFVVVLPFLWFGARALMGLFARHPEYKMLLALCGAYIFVLSALKLPSLTGSSSHPIGVGLGAILFGPGVMVILGSIVLLFQALLLAHGGLTTFGANVFSMAVVGPLVAYAVYRLAQKAGLSRLVAVFLAAALAGIMTYAVTALQLALAFPMEVGGVAASFARFAGIFALTQLPLAISEGILTVLIFNVLWTYNQNDVVNLLNVRKGGVLH